MESKKGLSVIYLFILLAFLGGALIIYASTPFFLSPEHASGFRTIGFSLLFLGIGEYLNRPTQVKLTFDHLEEDSDPIRYTSRERTPCGLGNLLDILALITLFIGVSRVLFPIK